jgi:ceramide glucosyltransferase
MAINDILTVLVIVCLAGAAFGCLYMVLAAILTLRLGRQQGTGGQAASIPDPMPVTILVPLCGYEPGLEARLRALCSQDYPAPVQILCGIRDHADTSLAMVEHLAAEFPPGTIEWHVDPRLHGRNFKVSNLMNLMPRARHGVFVMIDSDIQVGLDYLRRVTSDLRKPNVGAVTCLYIGVRKGGIWAQLSAMDINFQFLPSAIVALWLRRSGPCFGATIAMTRETMDKIGGLARFADHLWDDYAIGQAVRAAGLRVSVPSLVVHHVCSDRSASELFGRLLRSARTLGSIDPRGHAGAIITYPLALSLLAFAFGGGDAAIALALTSFACRAALGRCIEHRFGTGGDAFWLLPLRDLAAFGVYIFSFCGGTVSWRGRRYRVDADGTLFHAPRSGV